MKLVSNIGTPIRIGYAIAGAALIAVPFITATEGWIRIVIPILGAIAVVEGLVGW